MNVKWIKISTQMFDDEKIRLIEQLPEADTILIIWVKLLAQAGKTNASGYIFLNENIPFSDEMLSTIFNRPLPIVRLALQTLQQFGMIDVTDDNFISISNWEKHQNVAGLDKIREQNRIRVAKHRENKRLGEGNQGVTLPVMQCNATDIELDIELDKEKEKEKEKVPYVEIVNYLNSVTGKSFRHSTNKTKKVIDARIKEKFSLDDFKKVIDIKSKQWLGDSNMETYLRPETLFGTKFESYLNEKGGSTNGVNRIRDQQPTEYQDGLNF